MHSSGFFLNDVAGFLGGYYVFLAIMNGIAALILWRKKDSPGWALVWSVFAGKRDSTSYLLSREGLPGQEHNGCQVAKLT